MMMIGSQKNLRYKKDDQKKINKKDAKKIKDFI